MDRPFEGLKVLDLSAILAGPLVGSFFAELGADVIKIENKLTKGDATRQWKLTTEDPEATVSAYYCAANYGKDVQLLDLSDEKERQTIDQLLAESDVVISNFQKKSAEKLKLTPEYINAKFPHLIFAQLSAYTYDDPRPGYDLVMQGETGWISMNGIDGQHMAKLPVAIIDIIAAHQMKEAVLIALLKKMKDGKGSVVHVSLYKSAISALANQASNYLMAGHIPKPIGTLHPNIAPYGDVFSTSDGQKLILAVGSDAQFKKLWFSLTTDDDSYHKFALNSQRLSIRSLLHETLQQLIGSLSYFEMKHKMELNNIPFCLISNMAEVFEDELAKSMILNYQVDQISAKSVSNLSFRFPKP